MKPLATTIALAAAVAAGVGYALSRRGRIAEDEREVVEGMFGPIKVIDLTWEDGRPVRVMSVHGSYQSSTYLDEDWDEPVFEYYYLYDLMFDLRDGIADTCMLGGGGYSYPKWLLANHPEVRMDVVEIDPSVTKLARRSFFLDEALERSGSDALGLVTADGREWLAREAAAGRRFDAILNDTFSGVLPAPTLTTLEAARTIHEALAPGGLYLTNIVGALEGPYSRFPRAMRRTLSREFDHVAFVPVGGRDPRDRQNIIAIASDAPFGAPVDAEVAFGPDDPILTDADNPVEELCLGGRGSR